MVFKELDCYEKIFVIFVESLVIWNYIEWLIVLFWINEMEDMFNIYNVE